MRNKEPHTAVGDFIKHSSGKAPEPKRLLIAAKARSQPKEKFNNLTHHLTVALIKEQLYKTSLNSAPGVDGMTVGQARENADWLLPPLIDVIHKGRYEAPPVRRVYIPKANGDKRPLGVPEVIDRSLQAATANVLNEIYEQDFLSCSFGFRPKLSCHHALATVNKLMHGMQMNFALEVDIRDFFGSLNHEWLRKFLGLRIGDKRILKLIDSWLKAGVIEDGKHFVMEKGTPQGGSISPLLSNIYLHYVLDLWFERKIKSRLRKRANLVRYADDFVILFQDQQDMKDVKILLAARLNQFGLTIAEEKTHMTDLTPRDNQGGDRRRITFLGFNIFRTSNRKSGGYKTVFQTEGRRFTRAKAAMKERLFRIMHWDVEKQAEMINSMLVGHFNYYGLAGNTKKLETFRHYTVHYWRRCLSRRSQKGLVDWEKMAEIVLKKYPLARTRIKIKYQELDSYVRL
jgi:group II intron reverse transcriptase/maturase